MGSHEVEPVKPVDVVGEGTLGDKKSHYTAFLVGVGMGTFASSIALLAVAMAHSSGS